MQLLSPVSSMPCQPGIMLSYTHKLKMLMNMFMMMFCVSFVPQFLLIAAFYLFLKTTSIKPMLSLKKGIWPDFVTTLMKFYFCAFKVFNHSFCSFSHCSLPIPVQVHLATTKGEANNNPMNLKHSGSHIIAEQVARSTSRDVVHERDP